MTLHVFLQHCFDGFDLDIRFDAPPGLTVLFGPSGAGKTTLINAVAGLLRPDRGRITADDWVLLDTDSGQNLPPHRRRLGYIFQEGRLFPHLTVRQNLLYGRWCAPRAARREDPARVIEMLGISHLLDRRPGALSGGERSRVAIGRALLAAPKLILADEPLAALDEARKAEILPYFERLRDEVTVPILYVTHALPEVARLATTVIALRQGRVAAAGPAAQVLGDSAAVGARAAAATLTARVVAHHAEDGLTEMITAAGPLWLPRVVDAPGTPLRIRILAHEVILSRDRPSGLSALNILPGTITRIHQGDGPGAVVHLAIGSEEILIRITRRACAALDLKTGDSAHAILKSMSVARDRIWTAPAQNH